MAGTTVGGVIETKEIGLTIGVDKGIFNNAFYDSTDNTIKLAITDTDGFGNPIYAEQGSWISEVINLSDKFLDYDKVFTNHTDNGASSIAISTRTSHDSMTWDDWTPVALDGTIQSETKQFIQVRIDFFAGYVTDVFLISEFDNEEDRDLFTDKTYIDTSNGLRLKREYEWDMTKDATWTDTGSLHRKAISRADWLRVDKLNVTSKEIK